MFKKKTNLITSEYILVHVLNVRGGQQFFNLYVDMIAASQRCHGNDRGNSEGEMWNQGVTAQPVQEIQRGPDS